MDNCLHCVFLIRNPSRVLGMDAAFCWSPYHGSLCARECSLTAWIMTHWSQRSEELGQHSYIA